MHNRLTDKLKAMGSLQRPCVSKTEKEILRVLNKHVEHSRWHRAKEELVYVRWELDRWIHTAEKRASLLRQNNRESKLCAWAAQNLELMVLEAKESLKLVPQQGQL